MNVSTTPVGSDGRSKSSVIIMTRIGGEGATAACAVRHRCASVVRTCRRRSSVSAECTVPRAPSLVCDFIRAVASLVGRLRRRSSVRSARGGSRRESNARTKQTCRKPNRRMSTRTKERQILTHIYQHTFASIGASVASIHRGPHRFAMREARFICCCNVCAYAYSTFISMI
jgi:hypothetical protein